MSDIRTYNDLLAEKKRLEAALLIQKGIVRDDLLELREEFRPVLNVLSTVSKMTTRNGGNPLIAMGVGLLGEVFLANMTLARGASIIRFIVPFLAKKATTYFGKKDRSIFQKLAGIWRKTRSNGSGVLSP
ncbi:MAG TPA: hypothetical protein VK517_10675 [Cyclobacteriaceae bacterium]|jgi:hypothetical protein|nr:hypothetical protein [Cyclobacteriaceae bacterium]